jgi:site-specific recombinase XerD
MEALKHKYVDFLLKTKGVSDKYAEVVGVHLDKLIRSLQQKGITDIAQVDRQYLNLFQEEIIGR